AEPHVAGSPRDRALAEWVRDRWREYGLEQVAITEHEVLLPYATDVSVEMTLRPAQGGAAALWRATLKEDPVAGDPFSARDVGLPYHAYSASGDVTAPVVYAAAGIRPTTTGSLSTASTSRAKSSSCDIRCRTAIAAS